MNSLDKIITALAPIFAAGFAVQQLLEILTSFLDLDSNEGFQRYKKPILGAAAFGLGCALAVALQNGVLGILQGISEYKWTDFFATALVISAGTEGVNSILKFLKYSKEDKKREAAGADPQASLPAAPAAPVTEAALRPAGGRAATEDSLARINRQ
jgi:hypothetical protein